MEKVADLQSPESPVIDDTTFTSATLCTRWLLWIFPHWLKMITVVYKWQVKHVKVKVKMI